MIAVFLYALITDYNQTSSLLKSAWSWILFVLNRFIIGFSIAYMLNFLVEWLRKMPRFPKPLAIITAYLVFLGVIAVFLVFVIPLVYSSLEQIIRLMQGVPRYYSELRVWIQSHFTGLDGVDIDFVTSITDQVNTTVLNVLKGLLNFSNVEGVLRSSTRVALNILFGLIISIYALIEKEKLIRACKNIINAFVPGRRADGFIEICSESNRVFSQFLVGKLIDSAIIGVLTYILFLIFRMPQNAFLAIIVGVTNMVPYFGPMVGGIVSVIILLFYNPWYALTGLIIIVCVQQFDGWVLGPKILGNAVGISPLLTIIAITIGGDIGGFMGIFLAVPAAAVFKSMIYDRIIAGRLEKRRLKDEAAEAPVLESDTPE